MYKDKSVSSLKVYFSAHHINDIKKHNTILLNNWISEIIIKTTFNNTLKYGVTSALRMMCVDRSGLQLSLVIIPTINEKFMYIPCEASS
jgi:hypothetical protein